MCVCIFIFLYARIYRPRDLSSLWQRAIFSAKVSLHLRTHRAWTEKKEHRYFWIKSANQRQVYPTSDVLFFSPTPPPLPFRPLMYAKIKSLHNDQKKWLARGTQRERERESSYRSAAIYRNELIKPRKAPHRHV